MRLALIIAIAACSSTPAPKPRAGGDEPAPIAVAVAPADAALPDAPPDAAPKVVIAEVAPPAVVPKPCKHYVEVVMKIIRCEASDPSVREQYRQIFEATKLNWKAHKYDPATGTEGGTCVEAAKAFEELMEPSCK